MVRELVKKEAIFSRLRGEAFEQDDAKSEGGRIDLSYV